ncbi:hypothetical protein A2U01_0080291, partial [Trifolium medium]|nr:hypothetical protein [Trifolium medium]
LFSPSEECLGHKESRLRKNHEPTGARHPISLSSCFRSATCHSNG